MKKKIGDFTQREQVEICVKNNVCRGCIANAKYKCMFETDTKEFLDHEIEVQE